VTPTKLRAAATSSGYAVAVVDFALAAIDEAEGAVLDGSWPGPTPTLGQPTADGSSRA
jgi:hypothetical protein